MIFSQSPSHAGVYKWIDEDGQVHYGEQPGNTSAEKVPIRTNETTAPRTMNKDKVDMVNSDLEEKDKKRKEAEEQRKISRDNRKWCNEARSDLQAIYARGRMREINEKGEYIVMTEEQRQQRISAAKKKQREFCK
ncbi:MAG: DUF4124 domain-containing protein [Gammaproteobacteria bacterium]|nr:DUF4124 domain-containing protein [Gammaproteobacteria bacterium]NNJ48949.1 DUF4124 domain-containing protein [Gammaproteobacteria bacterium]